MLECNALYSVKGLNGYPSSTFSSFITSVDMLVVAALEYGTLSDNLVHTAVNAYMVCGTRNERTIWVVQICSTTVGQP